MLIVLIYAMSIVFFKMSRLNIHAGNPYSLYSQPSPPRTQGLISAYLGGRGRGGERR